MQSDSVPQLRSRVRGEVIEPTDAGYDSARKVYNAMIDKRPRVIVKCANPADVVHSVRFGREQGLLTAIRGGGHNGPGLGTCDDGLVIDLSRMRGIRIDPAQRTVRVDGGCTWGDVDHATSAFGLAVPSGIISTTGVGGLTLGGGIGHLSRRFGLTIDNLLSADMVLADGRFVKVNSRENEDLYWAIRGGGGNFGVVTSFEFRAHPVDVVHAGPALWPIERAGEAMRFYRDFMSEAPEELNGFFAFIVVPPAPPFPENLHMKNMCGVIWHYSGAPADADRHFHRIRTEGQPVFDHVGPVPHAMVQSMFDPLYPPGLQWYWKAEFVNELPDAAIQAHVKHGSQLPTMFSTMHMYPIDGAVHRVGASGTAFSARDARWAQVIVGVDSEPRNAGTITQWARDYYNATHPYASGGGAYVNFMMDEGEEPVAASYRENYTRLSSIKRRYDPDNFFRVNQNIRPAARGTATA